MVHTSYRFLILINVIELIFGKLENRIINGHEAIPHSIPYQVGMFITQVDDKLGMCGGSLVSNRFVLTAAHCVYESKSNRSILIILGAHDIYDTAEDTQQEFQSEEIIVHEEFDDNLPFHDVALVKMNGIAEINDYVQLIDLPSYHDKNNMFFDAEVRMAGWGKTADNSSVSHVLQQVCSVVIPTTECTDSLDINFVCLLGTSNQVPCSGDSGGPVITTIHDRDMQIGVINIGMADDCESFANEASLRVTEYLDWIERHSDVTIS